MNKRIAFVSHPLKYVEEREGAIVYDLCNQLGKVGIPIIVAHPSTAGNRLRKSIGNAFYLSEDEEMIYFVDLDTNRPFSSVEKWRSADEMPIVLILIAPLRLCLRMSSGFSPPLFQNPHFSIHPIK